MGLLKRLLSAITTEPPAPEIQWLNPDKHDGTPLSLRIREASWEGDETPMLTRGYEITNAAGFVLPGSSCGVTRWPKLGLYHFKIAGESHRPPEALTAAALGAPAVLVAEPTNPYDTNAVQVQTKSGVLVGYVASGNTKSVRRVMQSGPVHAAFWTHHLRNGRDLIALEVMVWRPGVLSGMADAPVHPPWQD